MHRAASRTCNWNLRTMRPLSALRFPRIRLRFNFEGSFATLRTLHYVADGFARGFPMMQNGGDLLGNGQLDLGFASQREESGGGANTFSNHPHPCQDFRQRAALAQFDAHLAISA